MQFKKEFTFYMIFGVLTTLVNILVYLFFAKICGVYYVTSNILAWFFSVLFAYVTNRIWVFESENSGILDTGLMILLIDILSVGDLISKIVVQIIVVIVNYVFSKWIVFK